MTTAESRSGDHRKRLIFCFDGTWNASEARIDTKQTDLDESAITNVLKLARAVECKDRQDVDQVVYYANGVGTGDVLDKYLGGLTGYGLSGNVLKAYAFLGHNFDEGDEIWCFGFSRGAYTARSFAGLIGYMGVLPPEHHHLLPEFYDYFHKYRDNERPVNRKLTGLLSAPDHPMWRRPYHAAAEGEAAYGVNIHFIGVWDTVGALGVPTPMLKHLSRYWVGFHNTYLGAHIQHAFQALALDERRRPFEPDLWTCPKQELENYAWLHEAKDTKSTKQVVEQVWFAGVHSNVGGGYRTRDLSDIPLAWMMERAADRGLALNNHWQERLMPNACGEAIESFTASYRLLSPAIPPLTRKVLDLNNLESVPINVGVHQSVLERVHSTPTYRPASLYPVQLFHPVGDATLYPVSYQGLRPQAGTAFHPMAPASDRRGEERTPHKPPIAIELEGHRAELLDFSAHGCRVRDTGKQAMAVGQRFQLNGTATPTYEIIWAQGKEYGARAAA